MARRVQSEIDALKNHVKRANTQLLMSSVMLFQFSAMLLLALGGNPMDMQALIMAVALPSATYVLVKGFSKLWPIDRAILILALFLCSVSLVTLQDISRSPITPQTQAIHMCVGLVAMVCGIVFIRKVRAWEKWTLPLCGLALVLLLSPLVLGEWKFGAKNWITFKAPLDFLSFQPSEFVKLALIVFLSAAMSSKPKIMRCLPFLLFTGLLCVILLVERDLGALLIYFAVTVCIYFAATSNWIVTMGGLGIGVGGAFVAFRMFPYVQKRFEMFMNPWSDPQDSGYQIVQALIAIASGGAFGMGLGLGYPRNIPLYHSDFVFAALCEEFGLIFALGLLVIYVLIMMRGVSVAMNARTSFHSLVAFGVVCLIGIQTFIIVGGNIKMLPLTGVTLPLVSAGGSSIISMMGAIGLLLGVSSLNANDEVDDIARMQWRVGAPT